MITLRCHCTKTVGVWGMPVLGDGGTLTLRCRRCGPHCPACHGFPTFRLQGPILVEPAEDVRALWDALVSQAS